MCMLAVVACEHVRAAMPFVKSFDPSVMYVVNIFFIISVSNL